MMNRITMVTYDITNNKLRRKLDKVLCGYGLRMQYSVFRCMLDSLQVANMQAQIAKVLTAHEKLLLPTDSVVIIGGLRADNFLFLTPNPCGTGPFLIY